MMVLLANVHSFSFGLSKLQWTQITACQALHQFDRGELQLVH